MDDKLNQVLHKVELLCEQNPEFAAVLKEKLSVGNTHCSPTETAAFIKLQRKNMRQKGRLFYQGVKDEKLRNQLVDDYAMMLWQKCIGDIPRMFAYVLFQMENMLNVFLQNDGNAAYEAVKANPEMFVYRYCREGQKPYESIARDYFFDAKGRNKPVENIGIWAKYTYWFVSTQQQPNFQSLTHSLVSDVINFRNNTEHRNSVKGMPDWMPKRVAFWSSDIDAKYSYIDILLTAILKSILKIDA